MVKYSFIIPMYNCSSYIQQCVHNILMMDRKDVEIILIDDGSSDNTKNICNQLTKNNPVIKYYYQPNSGVSEARNNGLKKAKGEYIIFIDADDSFESYLLNNVLDTLDDYDNVDMVIYGISFDYYYHGRCYRRDELHSKFHGVTSQSEWMAAIVELYKTNALSPVWNKVFRKQLLIENDLSLKKNMFFYEDLEYSIRTLAYCNNILFLKDTVYHYRQTEDEGNAGRRLKRINHIDELITDIENAFATLKTIESSSVEEILLELYCVIAREKVEVSSVSELSVLRQDLVRWLQEKGIDSKKVSNTFLGDLIDHSILWTIINRKYRKTRHFFAVRVKNMILFRLIKRLKDSGFCSRVFK